MRVDLTAEGRLDILEKVMAYRGGPLLVLSVWACIHMRGRSGYTPQVNFLLLPRR